MGPSVALIALMGALASGTEVGPAVAPPAGVIDFCRREPQTCRSPGQDDTAFAAALAGAEQTYWRAVARRASIDAAPAAGPGSRRRARAAGGPAGAPWGGGVLAEATPLARRDPLWARVEAVNAAVNRELRDTPDERQYGQADYWAAPGPGPDGRRRGDCEDYVLLKRARLIAEGVPVRALSIALADTPWGARHAVLLVAAEGEEFVLDNLTSRVLPVGRADLNWRDRQRPGEMLQWIGPRSPETASAQAAGAAP
jgi:predicted transglutaminase-like cysteine proteinase